MTLTRRELLVQGASAAAVLKFTVTDNLFAADAPSRYAAAFRAIDAMAERYLREMNAPGMTLVIAGRDGALRVATYGLADLDRKEPVRPDHLFQIGSISKSFVGLTLLQLRDEGKIDLHAPVTRYLPWLRVEPRDVITTHHLLTHSSGLPSWAPVFPGDPGLRHTAGYTPGSHFWYCNMGYAMLGLLIETLDGRPYPEAVRARVLAPLGMNATVPYIGHDSRARSTNSYIPFLAERPYPRTGRLAAAPQIIFDNAAGSISSTPGDMGVYLRMIVNRGKDLIAHATFDDWVKGYVTADAPGESYGYGWFTGKLDEHPMIRHTGGMVSFMSALHVDLVDGIGAFASVNAQQGYRPNPVTTYAIRAIRAANAGKPMPELPPTNSPAAIPDADKLAGVYTSAEGDRIEFRAEGQSLVVLHGGKRYPVETAGGLPVVRAPQFDTFGFVFDREKDNPAGSVGHGARLWTREPKTFTHPDAWNAFTGHYRSDSPWIGSTRVVIRGGRLWLDGTTPLRPVDAVTFRIAEPDYCPEWVQFLDIVNGKSRHIRISGEDMWRVDVP